MTILDLFEFVLLKLEDSHSINEAASLEVIEPRSHRTCRTYTGTFNHLVDRFISNQLESIYIDHTSASRYLYQNPTVVGDNRINNRLTDTQLRRLSFYIYTRNFTGSSPLTLCQQTYYPVHYLLNCPAYPKNTEEYLKVLSGLKTTNFQTVT